ADIATAAMSKPITSIATRFLEAKSHHSLPDFPIPKKSLCSTVEAIASASFRATPRLSPGAIALKPSWGMAEYISVDLRPIVRARIRLGQALSFARMHLYYPDKYPSPNCSHCGAHGDTKHILLSCPLFHSLRQTCSHRLS